MLARYRQSPSFKSQEENIDTTRTRHLIDRHKPTSLGTLTLQMYLSQFSIAMAGSNVAACKVTNMLFKCYSVGASGRQERRYCCQFLVN
jgi:hypothetical protein